MTKETLEPYPIGLPSLAVQKVVVKTIQEIDAETQRLAELYERKLAALESLKKSLLHRAVRGGCLRESEVRDSVKGCL